MSPTSLRPAVPSSRPAVACPLWSRIAGRRVLVAVPLIAGLLSAGAATASAQPSSPNRSSAPAASAPATVSPSIVTASTPSKASTPATSNAGHTTLVRPAASAAVTAHRVAAPAAPTTTAKTTTGPAAADNSTPAAASPGDTAMTQDIAVEDAGAASPAGVSTGSKSRGGKPSARIGFAGAPAQTTTTTVAAPVATPAPTPAPAAASAADQVLAMLNDERAANGIGAVGMDGRLIASAHAHNMAMSAANTMSHQLPGEGVFSDRITAAGYVWRAAAENIGWTTDASANGALSLQLAMYNEVAPNDGHRRNILNAGLANVGIDVYVDGTGKLWITVDFGTPR